MVLYPNPKVNIGLNVIGLRPDGYHDIETLFVPYFGMRDTLVIEKAEEFSISIKGTMVDWDPQKDLTAKAFHLLESRCGIGPVKIALEKGIPVGAGLGGGSSDAAFTLLALNELFSLGLSKSELASLASELGSDCAFFIYNTPMLGSGRGEVLREYPLDLSRYTLRVEVPVGSAVSTAEAYRNVRMGSWGLEDALQKPIALWRDCLFNDFEASVFPMHPEIEALKSSFYSSGAIYASMSGSGSAVVGVFEK